MSEDWHQLSAAIAAVPPLRSGPTLRGMKVRGSNRAAADGHDLGPWRNLNDSFANAICRRCGGSMGVDTRDETIAGGAASATCEA